MKSPKEPKLTLFKAAIARNDLKNAREIIQLAIAANYPRSLTYPMQSELNKVITGQKAQKTTNEIMISSKPSSSRKIAVVSHCFYLDIWPEISTRLAAINQPFDLFVTTINDRLTEVSKAVHEDFANARIFSAPNKGMDIFPFLSILPILYNEGYEYVCKVQTKKGDGRLAIIWRDLMLDTLIGSNKNFCSAIEAFEEDDKLIMAGPGALYQSAKKLMLNNQSSVDEIVRKTWKENALAFDDWGFFAGTMFWARIKALLPLSQAYNIGSYIEDTKYQQDGKIEHGIERAFGLAIAIEGGKTGLMYPTEYGLTQQEVIRYSATEGIGIAHIGTITRAIEHYENSRDMIHDSNLFNPGQYLKSCPELANRNIDLVFHYLTTGTFKNYWPCTDIKPSHALKKKALESTNHTDVLLHICEELSHGKILSELQESLPHSSSYGAKEAHIIASSGLFDEDFYYQQRPDVKKSTISPIDHYLSEGVYDECYPNKYFIPREYLALNGDVANANIEPFTHYLTHGCLENRRYRETARREQEENPFLRYQALNKRLIDWNLKHDQGRDPDLISIVIPIVNNKVLTLNCISSILNSKSNQPYEVVCVDNGSDIDTKRALLDCKNKFGIKLIENDENYNFALGCNIGFINSSGETIVFLNNDTLVTDYWLDELVRPLNDLSIKAVQPRLLFPDLTVQCIGVTFAPNQVIGYPIYAGIDASDTVAKKSRRLKAITAACMAVRANDFARINGFDTLFINGQEDIDLCLRLCQESAQSSCYCQATSNVIHYESKTPGRGKYIKLNRINFANRWRHRIIADDFLHYSEDKFDIIDWDRDHRDFLELDIGASRPVLKRSRVSRMRYQWEEGVEEQFLDSVSQYYRDHPSIIDNCLITVVMPTRNRATIISRAIQSILNQTHQNFELLIIDDGSTDSTRDIVGKFLDDARVNMITIEFSGVSIARNTGLDMASGQMIAYLDSDNSWEPDFLRVMITYLTKENLSSSYSGIRSLDDHGKAVRFRGDIFDWDECLVENYIDINSFVHRKTSVRNDVELRRFVDWDFILRLTKETEVGFAPFIGVNYYDGSNFQRITNTVSTSQEETDRLQEYVRDKHSQPKDLNDIAYCNQSEAIRIKADIKNYRIYIKTPCPSILEAQSWGDYHLACSLSKSLHKLGMQAQVDTLDSWNNDHTNKGIVIVIRGLSSYNPKPCDYNVLWIISHPEKVTNEEIGEYDHIFVASEYYAGILRKLTKKPVSVLHQATDSQRFNLNQSNIVDTGFLFVGNSRQVYRPVVKHVIESGYDLAVYGNHWEEFIDKSYIKGRNILNTELGGYYAGADVVLNDHWESMASNGFISNRLFDCVACGAFIVSDYVEGISKIFGRAVFQYNDISEINGILDSRNAWPSKEELMEASHLVLKNHTFCNRAVDLLLAISQDCSSKLLSN